MGLPCLILEKTTTQTVASSTTTAVTWDNVATLTGPSSWVDLNTSTTSIIAPWPGQYYVSLFFQWESNGTADRYLWLTQGTDVSSANNAARVMSHGQWSVSATESGAYVQTSQVITVPSANTTYTVGCYQNTGAPLDSTVRNTSAAHASANFAYLGSLHGRTQVSAQAINRSHLW